METVGRLGVPLDREGFLARACPYCAGAFKVQVEDFESATWPQPTCPCCGLSASHSAFTPRDVRAAAAAVVANFMVRQINDTFGAVAQSAPRGGLVQFSFTPLRERRIPTLRAVTDLAVVYVTCCDRTIKLPFALAASLFYCPFCAHAHT